jgi:gamma-glutamyltranspeptidase/glutathione hydrolase
VVDRYKVTVRTRRAVRGLAVLALTPVLAGLLTTTTAAAAGDEGGEALAAGSGGGVATVDANATRIGLEVLAAGGTAADAAVAAAAALGVSEPYSSGIGGGGFFLHYNAETGEVSTIDGRETAPAAMEPDSFLDPETGEPLPFDRAVTSGLSVGVPGTLATWAEALERWGSLDLAEALAPAEELAREGFVVDETFRSQTAQNEERFRAFPATAELFLPGGELPDVGSVFTNPELADTYAELAKRGTDWFYEGELAEEIAATASDPPVDPAADIPVAPGLMTPADLAAYEAIERAPTHVDYRGVDVYGMGPPSSGGSTVGEALNILEQFALSADEPAQVLHYYLEASRFAYADRNEYLADTDFVDVPLDALLSDEYAAQRACLIDPKQAATSPVPPGDPTAEGKDPCAAASSGGEAGSEGPSTTHLVTADRWGNVVSYTLTIEQIGGSGITVPGRGFLLNNELTDFTRTPPEPGEPLPANAPAGGKRPRSSMAPTIVLAEGEPFLAVGSPGGSTIITTVLQVLVNRLDLGMTLPEAVVAPRASQRNTEETIAEAAFLESDLRSVLESYGHRFAPVPEAYGPAREIGAVTALEFLDDGQTLYVAEPERRGGGTAMALDGKG